MLSLQHSLNMSSSPSNKSSSDSLSHHNHVESSSCHTQGRPRAGSESSSGRGAVSKVMDMFRHRSHSAVSADDKRKAVSRLVYFINIKAVADFEVCIIEGWYWYLCCIRSVRIGNILIFKILIKNFIHWLPKWVQVLKMKCGIWLYTGYSGKCLFFYSQSSPLPILSNTHKQRPVYS